MSPLRPNQICTARLGKFGNCFCWKAAGHDGPHESLNGDRKQSWSDQQ